MAGGAWWDPWTTRKGENLSMIVSWKWLKQYVPLELPVEEIAHLLTMSGLNLESIERRDDDFAIDLEVTSNRPDCLGHIGIAREIAVLTGQKVSFPPARLNTVTTKTSELTSVAIDCPDLCPQYVARVIQGVTVGPSPAWMQEQLRTIGIAPINNVVDVTNYVLMECGQPLHTFDFDKLREHRIVVRRAHAGETIEAIDHKTYTLSPEMCVIADANSPVAIGGVMGGAATEIGPETVNVLVETARFAPLSIRSTARALKLMSDSSYRFERGVDEQRLLWASDRCCELILETAGGKLLSDPVVAGTIPVWQPEPIVLRFGQIARVLGIDVPPAECLRILADLGLAQQGPVTAESGRFVAPTWRRDLIREIDLIEEIGRIHGYDHVPEVAMIPVVATQDTAAEVVQDRIRDTLTAIGYFEAITLSFVTRPVFELFTPRSGGPTIEARHSTRHEENLLRQSLVPSLLLCRRENERKGTFDARLFEIASVYLDASPDEPETQPKVLGVVSGGALAELRGAIEAVVRRMNRTARVTTEESRVPQFAAGRGATLLLDGEHFGWVGELDRAVTDRLDLREAVTVAEISIEPLCRILDRAPQFEPLPQFPVIERDLNFVLPETVMWSELEKRVRSAAGPLLEDVRFIDQYRGKQIPSGRKSYVMSLSYRSPERTLTSDEVDAAQAAVVATCERELDAVQR